jgi:hypothetical protein
VLPWINCFFIFVYFIPVFKEMKYFFSIITILCCISCAQSNAGDKINTAAIDSLSRQLKELKEKYKPGLGEIMGGIQLHHAKLWFAGINNNWKLSAFEIDEIKELLESAKEIETDRPEIKNLPMIYPAVDSVAVSIRQQNPVAFKRCFQLLTVTCNSCHVASHFEFNVITIPSAPPVTNQDFKVHER